MFVKYLAASISSFIILKSLQQLGTYDSSHDSMTGSVMRMTVEITLKDNYHDESILLSAVIPFRSLNLGQISIENSESFI